MGKRWICCILLIGCILGYGIPFAHAAEKADSASTTEENKPPYSSLKEYQVTFSCTYRPGENVISISGNVSHEIMISYKSYTIEIYGIAPGQTIEEWFGQEDHQPLASTALAVKFEFIVKAEKIIDQFSQYFIIIRSPEGEPILAAEPQMVNVEAKSALPIQRRSFKGALAGNTSICGSLNFGTVIIPVYLDRLWCEDSSGYMYPMEDTYCYFDRAYIQSLDAEIRTYSANGGRVYLQLLLPAGSRDSIVKASDSGVLYDCPDVYSEEVIKRLSTYASFLSSRYSTYQNGLINGFIVGSSVDLYQYNNCGRLPITDYASIYALYAAIIANSARSIRSEIDVLIPFSNINTYSMVQMVENGYEPDQLLIEILKFFDSRFSEKIPFGTVIESSASPLAIDPESGNLAPVEHDKVIGIDNARIYSNYLDKLRSGYLNAPDHYMYLWNVSDELVLNPLACSYVYSYYSLFEDENLSSFVISFGQRASSDLRILDIQKILRYIDTESSLEITKNLLPYFGASTWEDVIPDSAKLPLATYTVHRVSPMTETPAIKGTFSYVEFSSKELEGWYSGSLCNPVKLSYSNDGTRVLRADMVPPQDGTYAELLCLYEYEENWVHTPYIKLTVELESGTKTSDTIYELVVSVGDAQSILIADCAVYNNQKNEILLDVSAYASQRTIQYIKIGVRPISNDQGAVSLLLHDIQGISSVYSSQELADLVESERLKIRNQTKSDGENNEKGSLLWIIFGILVAVTGIGAGVFMAFRRDDEAEDSDNPKDKKE